MIIGFINFYHQFIQRFNKIINSITSILKTSGNEVSFILQISKIGTLPGKDNNVEDNKGGDNGSCVTVRKSGGARNLASRLSFLTSGAKIAFAQLRKAFIKALILYYLELDWYIWIEIDVSVYAIRGILSHMTLEIG